MGYVPLKIVIWDIVHITHHTEQKNSLSKRERERDNLSQLFLHQVTNFDCHLRCVVHDKKERKFGGFHFQRVVKRAIFQLDGK